MDTGRSLGRDCMTLSGQDKSLLIAYKTERSSESLDEARLLLAHNHYSAAVNRIYYCMFYIVSALALKNDFSTSKHQQLIGWFNRNYVRTGIIDRKFARSLFNTFEKRSKSDYADFVHHTRDEVEMMITEAESFSLQIRELLS
jgi:uncharacterized protein (UPF0332 family)